MADRLAFSDLISLQKLRRIFDESSGVSSLKIQEGLATNLHEFT
jgi:hypothetical protein